MKILISCNECDFNKIDSSDEDVKIYSSYESVNDLGLYQIICPLGHITSMPLQEQKFEILFDLGFYAIADGYYREAISSFTSSLERFYEFYVNVIAIKNNIPNSEFDKSWKKMSNQSERQLGAFIISYLHENKISPSLLNDKTIQFRNAVIHKGKIPTREEALSYGKSVSETFLPTLEELRNKYLRQLQTRENEYIQKAISRNREKIVAQNPDAFRGIITVPTFLSLTRSIDKSFEEYLFRIEEIAKKIRLSPKKFWVVGKNNGPKIVIPAD